MEHNSELHDLLDNDTMPPGLPAASQLESNLPRQILDYLTEENDQPSDTEPPY